MRRRQLACLPALLAAPGARAQAFPTQPMRWVVPFPPGFTTNISRLIGDRMAARLGQPFVYDNRSGATGVIGSDQVAKARPDGYTVVMATQASHAVLPHLMPNFPYDPERDFAPIGMMAVFPNILVVRPALGPRNVAELLALARSRPTGLTYGSSGNGSSIQMVSEALAMATGVRLVHAPYRGATLAQTDLLAGHIDLMLDNLPNAMGQIQAGTLLPLATATEARIPQLPDVPTFTKLGIPGVEMAAWIGLMAPGGTPAPIVARLNAALNASLTAPEIRDRLLAMGAVPLITSPEEFATRLRADLARFRDFVPRAGIRLD
ncbi:MAG: tripartite tricarboxylate transporter substrate binding protein [Roseococcus sp.]